MTEKLYYQDAYLTSFTARVLDCRADGDRWAVILDRTVFYPEGGGQPGDTGALGEVRVLDTREQGDEILHLCGAPLPVGETVEGRIDWDRRFDFMQQHSGEHILSGLAHRRFGLDNVGFHMGAETVTVDLSGVLTWEQVLSLEAEANEIVWRNVPITALYPDEAALAALDFRSKKELSGWVRLIDIPGADLCACCALHTAATGAIGLVQVLSVQHFHEGVRIELLCGKRALDYVNQNKAQNRAISALLSAPLPETAAHVQRLLDEKAALEYRLNGLRMERLRLLASGVAGQEHALLFVPDLDADEVRRLCDAMMSGVRGVCAAFSYAEGKGFLYAAARLEPSQVKAMNAALNGRGGGKPGFAQGSLNADEAQIRAWFDGEIF